MRGNSIHLETANSPEEWLEICRRRRNAAQALLAARQPTVSWEQTGWAIEACLKAAIMKKTGMNRWPQPFEQSDLITHNLEFLLGKLGVTVRGFDPKDKSAAALKMVLEWNRQQGYAANGLPQRFAAQMYEAAFGSDGVVEWLASRYRLNI